MSRHAAALVVGLVLAAATPAAQSRLAGAEDLWFSHVTTDAGLTHGVVNAVLQDQTGFLWVATRNGLSRYDGYRVVAYRNEAGVATSLPGNIVTALAETRG